MSRDAPVRCRRRSSGHARRRPAPSGSPGPPAVPRFCASSRSRWACTTKKLVDMPTSNLLCSFSRRFSDSSRAAREASHAPQRALHLQRRVGHLGRHRQFERPNLGLGLLVLQLRPGVRRLLRALAQRVGERHADGPVGIVELPHHGERLGPAAGDRPDDDAALADELIAAEAAGAERGRGVQGGHHLVAEVLDVDVVARQVLAGRHQVGPLVERRRHGRLEDRSSRAGPAPCRSGRWWLSRPGRSVSLTMRRLSTSSAVRRVASACGQRLAPRGGLGLGRDDVHRRERAHLDADPVVLDELLGQRERLLRGLDRPDRGEQIPVGVLGGRGEL